MKYEHTVEGVFLERPNRFIAYVEIDGKKEIVHVKNTGRCKELLLPRARVILALSDNETRKTKYDLISVFKKGVGWINIDSQVPNAVVKEWLETKPHPFEDLTLIKPESVYGDSRVDFYLECGSRKILLEVKGCTLEREGIGYFPDAPTERGVKHLHELAKAVKEGYECYLAFVIAINGVTKVLPNREMHEAFGTALDQAEKAGVHILHLSCNVSEDEITVLH